MTQFALAHAADGTSVELAQQCAAQFRGADDHTLGFLYVTDPLAGSLDEIVEVLKTNTSVQNWVGSVGMGVCATASEFFERPAVVAMTGRFSDDEFRIIPSINSPAAVSQTASAGFAAAMGIVHVDPRNPQATELVASFASTNAVYLVGGLTSAQTTFAQIAGGVTEGGLSGVQIGGRRQVTFGLTQGCSPVGAPHEITQAQGNVLETLDDRPAIEVLYEEAGIAMGDDPRPGLTNMYVALLVEGSDVSDYLVRHLVSIDTAKGLIAITDDVSGTRKLMFVRRDADNADKDLHRMLDDLAGRVSVPPKAGLYFSCVARGPQLFAEPAHEMKAIQERFGDIPIVGFFGSGEVCNDRVYAYTGVLTLFHLDYATAQKMPLAGLVLQVAGRCAGIEELKVVRC